MKCGYCGEESNNLVEGYYIAVDKYDHWCWDCIKYNARDNGDCENCSDRGIRCGVCIWCDVCKD